MSDSTDDVAQNVWSEAVNRGSKLLTQMRMYRNQAEKEYGREVKASFHFMKQLTDNGWTRGPPPMPYLFTKLDFGRAIEIMPGAVSLECGAGMESLKPNKIIRNIQSLPYEKKSRKYHATKAEYINIFNPRGRLICALDNVGPASKIRNMENQHGNEVPDLHHWSDVVYLTWKNLSLRDRVPLRVPLSILRCSVRGPDICMIGNRAVQARLRKAPLPGLQVEWGSEVKNLQEPMEFRTDREDGKALLGSAVGVGVGYLLIQHKGVFGRSYVDRIVMVVHEKKVYLHFFVRSLD